MRKQYEGGPWGDGRTVGAVSVLSNNRVKAREGSGVEPSTKGSIAREADHSEDGWRRVYQEDEILRSACGLDSKGKIAYTLHMGSQCHPVGF